MYISDVLCARMRERERNERVEQQTTENSERDSKTFEFESKQA